MNKQSHISSTKGFTIIELLMVIIVIAILATISFVTYSNIRIRAVDAKMESNAKSSITALNLKHAEWGTLLSTPVPTSRSGLLDRYGLGSLSREVNIHYHTVSDECVTAISDNACVYGGGSYKPHKDKLNIELYQRQGDMGSRVVYWHNQKQRYIEWYRDGYGGSASTFEWPDCDLTPDADGCGGGAALS